MTDVSSDTTITLSKSINNYLFLVLRLSKNNPATSSSRGVILIPVLYSDIYAFYPTVVGGVNGNIRITASGTSFRVVEQNGYANIYIESISGLCIK